MPVYFIGEENSGFCRIKIGVAKDIEKRRGSLQTGNPSAIRLLGWINNSGDALLNSADPARTLRKLGKAPPRLTIDNNPSRLTWSG